MKTIKNAKGHVIAIEATSGNMITLQDANGKVVGRYYTDTNWTFTAQGQRHGEGNQLLSLLETNRF